MNIINCNLQLKNLDDTLDLYYNLISHIANNEYVKEKLNDTHYIFLLYGFCLLIEQIKNNHINKLYILTTLLSIELICKDENIIKSFGNFRKATKRNIIDDDVKIKLIEIISLYINFISKKIDLSLNINLVQNYDKSNILLKCEYALYILFCYIILITIYMLCLVFALIKHTN